MVGWLLGAAMVQAVHAQAAPAPAAAVPSTPAAIVSGSKVTHPGEKLAIHVPAGATYAGGERFTLYGVADAEIHVFVEADAAKKVRRLYWVQFESYLPGNGHGYNYAEGNDRADVAGIVTWVSSGPMSGTRTGRPGSDKESVMRILAKAGYALPAEAMHVRLVQMLDDPQGTGRGQRELMIIYAEDLAPTGKSFATLMTEGKLAEAEWAPLERPLIDRATKVVRIERL